ncbi:hypothetical protein B0T13DRAFT_445568 [Neurospora crassa]|nr:hypothetical protein B0T13DRAFT_445568 [Neurospora crassa]
MTCLSGSSCIIPLSTGVESRNTDTSDLPLITYNEGRKEINEKTSATRNTKTALRLEQVKAGRGRRFRMSAINSDSISFVTNDDRLQGRSKPIWPGANQGVDHQQSNTAVGIFCTVTYQRSKYWELYNGFVRLRGKRSRCRSLLRRGGVRWPKRPATTAVHHWKKVSIAGLDMTNGTRDKKHFKCQTTELLQRSRAIQLQMNIVLSMESGDSPNQRPHYQQLRLWEVEVDVKLFLLDTGFPRWHPSRARKWQPVEESGHT